MFYVEQQTRQTNVFINFTCQLQGEQSKRIRLTSTLNQNLGTTYSTWVMKG